ncbi:hypothetical protein D3C86_1306140 [compost metagenome]
MGQICGESLGIYLKIGFRSSQGIDSRREEQALLGELIVEWLLPRSVPGKTKFPLDSIPNRHGKHAPQLRKNGLAPGPITVNQYFSI